MHGTVFSFSPDLDNKKSKKIYKEAIERIKKRHRENIGESEAELESISKGLDGDPDELFVYEISGALDCISDYAEKGYKIIFASSSKIETIRKILSFLIEKKGANLDINSFCVHSILGDKREPESWEEILRQHSNISDVYDDDPEYLKATLNASKSFGNNPKLHTSVRD